MDINPYQPPADFAATLADDAPASSGQRTRPIGIWILSGLHLLVGICLPVAVVDLLWRLSQNDDRRGALLIVLIHVSVMAGVTLSSGVGLLLGARWGWWIASFYYIWAVLGVISNFMLMPFHAHRLDSESLMVYVLAQVIQLVIHALVLAYLLKSNVRTFYRLQSLRVDRALIPLVAIAIVLIGLSYYLHITRTF